MNLSSTLVSRVDHQPGGACAAQRNTETSGGWWTHCSGAFQPGEPGEAQHPRPWRHTFQIHL